MMPFKIVHISCGSESSCINCFMLYNYYMQYFLLHNIVMLFVMENNLKYILKQKLQLNGDILMIIKFNFSIVDA